MVLWLARLSFIAAIGVRIMHVAVKFHTAEVPLDSNRLFLCPLDVLNILHCHQPVPCALLT